tara:strand:- start:558 stop:749 length:192 start_codon:yes stop_codon:yes gene_type:complete
MLWGFSWLIIVAAVVHFHGECRSDKNDDGQSYAYYNPTVHDCFLLFGSFFQLIRLLICAFDGA